MAHIADFQIIMTLNKALAGHDLKFAISPNLPLQIKPEV
jgi:hypothetical protein